MKNSKSNLNNEQGFSLLEMIVAVGVLVILTASIASLVQGTFKISAATYEMTDAQENLRIGQEYVNRDLMNAGDGLKSISTIRVPETFVRSYLSLNPIADPSMPSGTINLGIITTDNNIPAETSVVGSNPAAKVLPTSDRQTVLSIDPTFVPIPLSAGATPAINSTGSTITVSAADIGRFNIGEVYFLTSSLGGTFATITAKDTSTRVLTFNTGDTFGLNKTGTGGHIKAISNSGTIPTSLMRMRIIHYYVTTDKLLMRREFGISGGGFRDSIIAEHVLNVQFNYLLNITDANGNIAQPTALLNTIEQRLAVRQVEVTLTVETPHRLFNGGQPTLAATTATSVRNMQFRQALQPTAGN